MVRLRCFAGVTLSLSKGQADRESAAEILSEVEGPLLSYRKAARARARAFSVSFGSAAMRAS
jgi:hypothetical protein